MNTVLEKLLILQDRDSRLSRLTSELQRIPEEKLHRDQQEKEATDALEQVKANARRIETERKKLEMDVAGKEDRIRKYKTQLLEIKNNDQFHAVQHEITMIEADIRKVEDVELELMEQFEKSQVAVKGAEAHFKEENQRWSAQRKDLDQKAIILEKQVSDLKVERERLAAEIEEDVLSRYDRIFRSKQNQAIARISNKMCMGCHLKLTAQEIHHAQRGDSLVTCTNCGRILYWMPE